MKQLHETLVPLRSMPSPASRRFACRFIDDYVAIFFGSTLLRTGKLLFIVLIVVHVFTCAYWLIKFNCANDPSEIEKFLSDRQLDETVPALPLPYFPQGPNNMPRNTHLHYKRPSVF